MELRRAYTPSRRRGLAASLVPRSLLVPSPRLPPLQLPSCYSRPAGCLHDQSPHPRPVVVDCGRSRASTPWMFVCFGQAEELEAEVALRSKQIKIYTYSRTSVCVYLSPCKSGAARSAIARRPREERGTGSPAPQACPVAHAERMPAPGQRGNQGGVFPRFSMHFWLSGSALQHSRSSLAVSTHTPWWPDLKRRYSRAPLAAGERRCSWAGVSAALWH